MQAKRRVFEVRLSSAAAADALPGHGAKRPRSEGPAQAADFAPSGTQNFGAEPQTIKLLGMQEF